MKRYFLSLIAAFFMISAYGAPEAEFKKISKEYSFYPDGSSDVRYYKELTINSHVALNDLYGETFIIYNPKYQSIKFNIAYTRQADGTIIKMPENAFNEVLPRNAANAPAYNYLKEMVVTHTGLEIGATIFLDYTVHSKAGYLPQGIKPETDDFLQEQSPIKSYEMKVNLPASWPFNYVLLGSNAKPKIAQKGEMKEFYWQFNNIPASSNESYIPDNQRDLPRLTTCCYESQEAALKTLQSYFTKNSNEIVESTAKELVNGKNNELEKIIAIQKYVSGQIASCMLDPKTSNYAVRTPAEVITTAYGTPMEKSILLASMLRAIGQNPEITVVYPSSFENKVKGLDPILSLYMKVDNNGKPLFISALEYPTESIALTSFRKDIWMISDQGILPLKVLEKPSAIDYKAQIDLSPEKASIKGRFEIKGNLMPVMEESLMEYQLKNLLTETGKITSSKVDSSNPRNISLEFNSEKQLSAEQDYIFYTLPTLKSGIATWNMNSLNSSRKQDFQLPYPIHENYEYDLVFSPETILLTKAHEIKLEKTFGKLHISISSKGNQLHVKKEIQLNKPVLSPAEYSDFRNMMNAWNDKNNNTIIIKTNTKSSKEAVGK